MIGEHTGKGPAPRGGGTGIIDITDGSTVEFGNRGEAWLPIGAVVDLLQVRETYDTTEIKELADRIPFEILPDGVIHFKLQNPPTINILSTEASARRYLSDHAEYYADRYKPILDGRGNVISQPQPMSFDEFSACRFDGKWIARVNGHRRGLAILLLCERHGLDPLKVRIQYSVRNDLSFEDAMQEQAVENTSSPIKPAEDAKAILRHRLWLRHRGRNYSNAELSRFFGFSEEKIANALRFMSLPEDMREHVGKSLTYGNLIALTRLRDAYEKQSTSWKASEQMKIGDTGDEWQPSTVEAEGVMRDYFMVVVLKHLRGKTSAQINSAIEAKIREVLNAADYQTGELFVVDEAATGRQARDTVTRRMGEAALLILRQMLSTGQLTDEMRDALAEALSLALPASQVSAPVEEQLFSLV